MWYKIIWSIFERNFCSDVIFYEIIFEGNKPSQKKAYRWEADKILNEIISSEIKKLEIIFLFRISSASQRYAFFCEGLFRSKIIS